MSELKIGKWYRTEAFPNKIARFDGLSERFTDLDIFTVIDFECFKVYENNVSSGYRNNFEPLETLTPKESLILLAEGFELVDDIYLILDVESGRFMAKEKTHHSYEFKEILDLNGFKIHELPNG